MYNRLISIRKKSSFILLGQRGIASFFLVWFVLVEAGACLAQSFGSGNRVAIAGSLSTVTNGMDIPGVYLSYEGRSFVISGTSIGFRSQNMYLSAYLANLMYAKKMGEVLGIEIGAGIGLGVFYAKRGFRERKEEELEHVEDWNGGLTTRVIGAAGDRIFWGMETFMGNSFDWVTRRMSTRDTASFLVGVRF